MGMALSELIKRQIEEILGPFCDSRVPAHVRNKVRLGYSFRGTSVLLFEERPYFQDPSIWTNSPIAQFRFNLEDKTWSLYYADRNSKWHRYERTKPSRKFIHQLRSVE